MLADARGWSQAHYQRSCDRGRGRNPVGRVGDSNSKTGRIRARAGLDFRKRLPCDDDWIHDAGRSQHTVAVAGSPHCSVTVAAASATAHTVCTGCESFFMDNCTGGHCNDQPDKVGAVPRLSPSGQNLLIREQRWTGRPPLPVFVRNALKGLCEAADGGAWRSEGPEPAARFGSATAACA
jgi:hypothetical protein